MKKLLLVLIFAVVTVFSAKFVFPAEQSDLTNQGFAEFMAGQMNIAIPAENKNLPPEQYYNSLANALSAAGISNFQNTSPDTGVNFAELAEVLFSLVKGTGNLDNAGKIDYLVNNGYLTEKSSPGSKVTKDQLQQIFANPKLSGLVAQTYVAPAPGTAGAPGSTAPGAKAELPASQI